MVFRDKDRLILRVIGIKELDLVNLLKIGVDPENLGRLFVPGDIRVDYRNFRS